MNFLKKLSITILIFISQSTAFAKTVEIVWPFSLGSSTTRYLRIMIDQANQFQSEYNFIFVHKPGAGGYIAANHVKNSNSISLLATSNAFFVRPYVYPNQSYDFREFQPVITLGEVPVAFIGKADSNWKILTQQKQILIGVVGLGSFSHMLAYQLSKIYPQTVIIPYQGPVEACNDVLKGEIDLCIEVPALPLAAPNLYKIHFITGNNDFENQFKLGTKFLDKTFGNLNLEFAIFTRSDINNKIMKDLTTILNKSYNTDKIKELHQQDLVTKIGLSRELWYSNNIQQWKSLTTNVKIDQ